MAHKTLEGTIKPYSYVEKDALTLHKAAADADKKTIIDMLVNRSNGQRLEIMLKYKAMFGKDLEEDIHGDPNSNYSQVIHGLLLSPAEFEADELHRTMKDLGTDEEALVEILCTRSNSEIAKMKDVYKSKYQNDLEKDLTGDTSGHFRRLLLTISKASRSEDTHIESAKVQQDAKDLYTAGEKKIGTDESVFCQILSARSHDHIRSVAEEYRKISKRTLEEAIHSETSGDLRMALLAIVQVACNKQRFFAERLQWFLKCDLQGSATHNNTVIRIVVSRSEIDLVQIMQEFQQLKGKTLEACISEDTSGDYKNLLLAIIKDKN